MKHVSTLCFALLIFDCVVIAQTAQPEKGRLPYEQDQQMKEQMKAKPRKSYITVAR